MSKKEDEGGGDGGTKEPTVTELRDQIENLNKGIAGYRDKTSASEKEAKEAKAAATAAQAEVADLKKVIEGAKDDDEIDPKLNLNPQDQKRLEKWAKDNGFVTKEELEKEKNRLFAETLTSIETQAVEEFLQSHPEYSKDENWSKVKEQFILYKQPTTITGYRQLLTRIHSELSNADDKAARVRAQEEQRKRLGLGGGNGKDEGGDVTIEQLQERYPKLSREQIISRLSEINDLAKSRAERNSKKK